MERERFDLIKNKHGGYSSWAVWASATEGPKSNIDDLTVLDADAHPTVLQTVNPAVIMVGLNISRSFDEPFRHFHDHNPSDTDFKLRFAFTDTPYYGGYMTDVVKNVQMVKSRDLLKYLGATSTSIDSHMNTFREEVRDLGCMQPLILAFGADAYKLLLRHLRPHEYRALVRLTHYSHYISKDKYRQEVLATLASCSAAQL